MKFFCWITLLTLILCLGVMSCSKDGGSCLTNTGPVITLERITSDFDTINVNEYVNVILTQDTINRVRVEAGKNIINGISTEVTDRTLFVHNNNQCNWLRSYNSPINVYLSVRNLRKIYYNSSGNITTTNPITTPTLWVDGWGGCGTIDLELNIDAGTFIQHMGTADFKLRGKCKVSSIHAGDFGLFECREMETAYSFIRNEGSNDCYIKVIKYLDATIGSIGSIYYRGAPDSINIYIHGSGVVEPF